MKNFCAYFKLFFIFFKENLSGGIFLSSKTKIVVLHMKELIYTAIFVLLAIVLVLLLISMFTPQKSAKAPGSYTKQEVQMDRTS